MAYDVQLVQINAYSGGLQQSHTAWGFPAPGTTFSTLLMSYWMCGPPAISTGSGYPGIWPTNDSAAFFTFDPGTYKGISFTNQTLGSAGHFYQGTWTLPAPGYRMHFLMSVDTHAQVVQLYVNDQPVTVTGTWTGTPPYNFNLQSTAINIWNWNVSNVTGSGRFPGLGDPWISNTPSFVDLSVVANRRKFINGDLTPVDLGSTGTGPFGYQPAMYMSVRPGGVATDILTNLGAGGGVWVNQGSTAPSFQAPGTCSLPVPPPPPPSLAMDEVIAIDQTPAFVAGSQVFLLWSDDRGHSFGSPVGQPIGQKGEYLTSVQYQRLGYARDRVFKLEWSVPVATALLGAYIEVESAKS